MAGRPGRPLVGLLVARSNPRYKYVTSASPHLTDDIFLLISPNLRPVQLQETTMSRSTLGKCCKKELGLQDRISRLPEEVIVSILSSLSLKEAAATSILSSHWVDLWKFTARLNFDATEALIPLAQGLLSDEEENAKYIKWVNQVLLSRKCSTLEEFRVCFDLSNNYQKDIDGWLKFVLAREVQKLELNFRELGVQFRIFEECYTFPFKFVAQNSGPPKLTSGGTYTCTFGCSKSLRELSFSSVNVTGEVIKQFLSNCPHLERLAVYGSGQLTNLEVYGPSLNLKYLEIRQCYKLDFVKICNTNIVSVKFWGRQGRCILLNNPFLVEVWLGYVNLVAAISPKPSKFLSQLEFLRFYTETFPKNMVIPRSPRLCRLKQLEVQFFVSNNRSLLGFSSLVRAAPCLQKFVMELLDFRQPINHKVRRVEEPPYHPHHQLKIVELKGYFGANNNLEVIMYFLKNALALEELVIDPRIPTQDPYATRFVEKEEAARKLARQQIEEISHLAMHVKISIL